MINRARAKNEPSDAPAAKKERRCLLVMGMHRSGTSAVTRILSLLGAELPQNLLPPAPDNELGFWESKPLVDLNNEILSGLEQDWDDWRQVSLRQLGEAGISDVKSKVWRIIDREFGTSSLFVLKDPRISRIASLYLDVLSDHGVDSRSIICFRNPLSVIASLAARNDTTASFASLVWLRHLLDAEALTRGRKRAILSFESLLANWRITVESIGRQIEISWPRSLNEAASQIDEFLSIDYSHHAPGDVEELDVRDDIAPWIKEGHNAFLMLEKTPEDAEAIAILDRIRAVVDDLGKYFGDASFPEFRARKIRLQKAVREQRQNAQSLENSVYALRSELEAANLNILAHGAEAAALTSEISALQGFLDDRNKNITALDLLLAERANELAVAHQSLAEHDNELDALRQALTERNNKLGTLQQALTERNNELGTLRQALTERNNELGTLRLALIERNNELGTLQQALTERNNELGTLRLALTERNKELGTIQQALTERNNEFAAIRQALAAHHDELGTLRCTLDERDTKIASLTSRISALYSSTSWRITSPMRYAMRLSAKLTYSAVGYPLMLCWKVMRRRSFMPLRDWRNVRVIKRSGMFDCDWYLAKNPDVAALGINPIRHYVSHGAREGRDPSSSFGTRAYLSLNPDVERAGLNPLAHYARYGVAEHRPVGSDERSPKLDPSNFRITDELELKSDSQPLRP